MGSHLFVVNNFDLGNDLLLLKTRIKGMSTGFLSRTRMWRNQSFLRSEQRNELYKLYEVHSIHRCKPDLALPNLLQETGREEKMEGEKRVRFSDCDLVMLIPTKEDYKKNGFHEALWYKKIELDEMRDSAVVEVQTMMKTGTFQTVRCVMNALYQPESVFPDIAIDANDLDWESSSSTSVSPTIDNSDNSTSPLTDDDPLCIDLQASKQEEAQFCSAFDEEEINSSLTEEEVYQGNCGMDGDDDSTARIFQQNKKSSARRPPNSSRSNGFLPHMKEAGEDCDKESNLYYSDAQSKEQPYSNLFQYVGINMIPELQPNLYLLVSPRRWVAEGGLAGCVTSFEISFR